MSYRSWGDVGDRSRGADYDVFVLGASPRLLRAAYLLTGDRGAAEDLPQDVLERLFVAWPRVQDPMAYAHRSLVHASTNRWRRRSRSRETPLSTTHDVPVPDLTAAGAERDRVVRALGQLPAGQRAVVVLRFLEDLSEAQTAAALGCSPGTVKSQCSRALHRLRDLLDEAPAEETS